MAVDDYDGRIITFKRSAWWDVAGAHVFTEPLSLVEAGERAKVAITLAKRPLWYMAPVPGEYVAGPDGEALPRQKWMKSPQDAQLVRESDEWGKSEAPLGVVNKEYPIWQNRDILEYLNPLTIPTEERDYWPVESIGMLAEGRDLFFSLNMGGAIVAGEDYRNLLGFWERRDAAHQLVAMFTSERQVCRNTCVMAMNKAEFLIKVPHTGRYRENAELVLEIMAAAKGMREAFYRQAEYLAEKPLCDGPLWKREISTLLERLLPEPSEPAALSKAKELVASGVSGADQLLERAKERGKAFESERLRILDRRDLVIQTYDRILDSGSPIAGTAWGVYQAVVEVADHEKQARGDRAISALVGDRAKLKADALRLVTNLVR